MADWVRKFLYRIFCVMALMVSVYLIVDFLISGTFDYRVFNVCSDGDRCDLGNCGLEK